MQSGSFFDPTANLALPFLIFLSTPAMLGILFEDGF
jgi:hypothetical protein